MSNGDPTVLGMIHKNVQTLIEGQNKIQDCVVEQKVKVAKIEVKQKDLIKDFDDHKNNPDIHLKPSKNDALKGVASRYKTELGGGGLIATIVAALIYLKQTGVI